ncbi:peroxynitrite isomerase THAP4-like [Centroberyx affinis]|uniref:peroxynitrite isomerase THAP4-like n=1 Tax=Centroberyx affinis TaxID=166261 RepID=UPI003A5BE31A
MVSTCIVPGCKDSKRKRRAGVSYYRLPVKDPERCRQWLEAANNPKYGENTATGSLQNLRVCSLHFKPEDYEHNVLGQIEDVTGKKLKETAVPSIGLDEEDEPGPSSAQPPGAKCRRVQNPAAYSANVTVAATLATTPMSAAGLVGTKDDEESGPFVTQPPPPQATQTSGEESVSSASSSPGPSLSPSPSGSSGQRRPRKRRHDGTMDQRIMKRLEGIDQQREQLQHLNGEDTKFALGMADILRGLPPRQKSLAKFKIHQLLFEMEQEQE